MNMFAGVGCFSIILAKHSNAGKVYSIDVNPSAVRFMEGNIRLNRVYRRVIPILGDAKEVIRKQLRSMTDRVLMSLPPQSL